MEIRRDEGFPGPDGKKSPRRCGRGPEIFRGRPTLTFSPAPEAQSGQARQAGAQEQHNGRRRHGAEGPGERGRIIRLFQKEPGSAKVCLG